MNVRRVRMGSNVKIRLVDNFVEKVIAKICSYSNAKFILDGFSAQWDDKTTYPKKREVVTSFQIDSREDAVSKTAQNVQAAYQMLDKSSYLRKRLAILKHSMFTDTGAEAATFPAFRTWLRC